MGIPAHEATTRHLGAAYPFLCEPGIDAGVGVRAGRGRGVLVGRDLLGARFFYDPFELYRSGFLTNPNMVVIGQIGRGKSAFVKTYLWRLAVYGRRAWVVDPKGEYGALARAWGVEPVALRPGGSIRLNPLDAVPTTPGFGTDDEDVARQRCELLASLSAASLGRPLLPTERSALDLAVAGASSARGTGTEGSAAAPTLPTVVDALLHPDAPSAVLSAPTSLVWPPTAGTSHWSSVVSSPVTSGACSTVPLRRAFDSTPHSSSSICRPCTTRRHWGS